MKTDRFADIIRRKLESIRPEFTEKDWARMQDSLHQANLSQPGSTPTGNPFSGGVWAGKPWLLAAATVSTVALITVSVWQRREITELRQTISQLTQTHTQPVTPGQSVQTDPKVSRPNVTDSATEQTSANQSGAPAETRAEQLPRPDTVYITRYVAAPSSARPAPPSEQPPGQRSDSPVEQRYATNERTPVSTPMLKKPKNLNEIQKTDSYGATFTPANVDKNGNRFAVTTDKSAGKKTKSPVTQQTETGVIAPANSGNNPDKAVAGTVPTQPASAGQQTGESSASYEQIASLPLSTNPVNWQAQLSQRAKRLRVAPRPMQVVEQVAAKAPASQPVQQLPVRFRAGLSGEVEAHMWSAGLFGEMPMGKRWMLGLGLNRATFMGGTFLTDDDFNTRTHRDFRKEFARGMIPPKDILNIDTRMIRLQIPLTLSYRLPLSRAFTLLPTVGTYLNLTNNEKITFYYRDLPQRSFNQASYIDNHPVTLLDSFTLSAGLEWQGGRWVIQGHPVVTLPLQSSLCSTPDPRWQTATTIGFRARLMYQF